MAQLYEKINSQRTREEVVDDFGRTFSLSSTGKYKWDEHTRTESALRLSLEVQLDIRDLLTDMRLLMLNPR